jgi:hypothetical protein
MAEMMEMLLTDDATAVEPDMILAGADDSRSVEESVHRSSNLVAFASISVQRGSTSSRVLVDLYRKLSVVALNAVMDLKVQQ